MELDNIAVLLAAYNGKKWIKEQIDSILNQSNVNVTIYISVDRSDDDTYQICCDLAVLDKRLIVLNYGERFGGAGRNFYRLIREVDFSDYDYVSFSDQDDIWLHDKIYNAISEIKRNHVDGYSSNVIAFWEDGRKCLINKAQKQVAVDFMFESAGPGCTYVLTTELCSDFKNSYLLHSSEIESVALHDWMLYAYARSKNYKWFIDANPSMLYRQHANNQIGANGSLEGILKRCKQISGKWYVNEVIKISDVLGLNNTPYVKYILSGNYIDNLALAMNVSRMRRRLRDRLALFVFCIAGLMRK
ncbi:glycosyltransferase [Citrobacter portucalensis]|uniref:glycosyltransferase n=1 Tax=Citrobacter portucalensis TaxID=1639133 RepID=UPI00226B6E00|nr:glycosyltransferase [Citrobacter portucalensis]MCX9034086.1 glycosyltransferase [Citrobacter portucalensis]